MINDFLPWATFAVLALLLLQNSVGSAGFLRLGLNSFLAILGIGLIAVIFLAESHRLSDKAPNSATRTFEISANATLAERLQVAYQVLDNRLPSSQTLSSSTSPSSSSSAKSSLQRRP